MLLAKTNTFSGCTVKDLKEDRTESGMNVQIIDQVCYASVLKTMPKSAIISTKKFEWVDFYNFQIDLNNSTPTLSE